MTPFALATFADSQGTDRIGLVVGDRLVDLAAASAALEIAGTAPLTLPAEMRTLIERWSELEERVQHVAAATATGLPALTGTALPVAGARLRAPIRYPWNLLAVAANYRAHADEMGRAAQVDPDAEDPVFFTKSARDCIADPGEPFRIPPGRNIDWEGELAIVVGREGKDLTLENAADHIFGYTIAFDVSDRGGAGRPTNSMFPAPYWFRGKSRDGAAPMGPVIVPRAFLPNSGDLRIVTRVNGEIKQDGSTSRLIYDEAHLLRFVSSVLTLRPGDVLLTGTPDGVGVARVPPEFLRPGDVVTIEIEGIGTLTTPMAATLDGGAA